MSNKITKEFPCWYFRQRPQAPVQCVFIAGSDIVSDWACAPTKTAKSLRNFQRAVMTRHAEEISSFFSTYEENSSPSAVVVGFREKHSACCLKDDGSALSEDSVKPGEVISGKIAVEYWDPTIAVSNKVSTEDKLSFFHDLLSNLRDVVHTELIDGDEYDITDENGVIKVVEDMRSSMQQDDHEDEDDEGEENGGPDEDSIDSGDSNGTMVDLEDRSELTQAKIRYLVHVEDLLEKIDSGELPNQKYLRSALDAVKPGLIIDGQHRVEGTKKTGINFIISALPFSEWPELAFQFIVLNKSAKKVSEGLLINIVGNSLSDSELKAVDKRLSDSGVPVSVYKGVMLIHDDPDSPFYRKLRFGIDEESGVIDAQSAKAKIVAYWFEPKGSLYKLLRHLMEGRLKRDKIMNWQLSGEWYRYLKCFWGVAKEKYEDTSELWSNALRKDGKTPISRLLQATVINLTHTAIIDYLYTSLQTQAINDPKGKSDIDTKIKSVDDFREYIDLYFKRLKPEFFIGWGPVARGMDGSAEVGQIYMDAVKQVIGGKKISALKSESKPADAHLLFKP